MGAASEDVAVLGRSSISLVNVSVSSPVTKTPLSLSEPLRGLVATPGVCRSLNSRSRCRERGR